MINEVRSVVIVTEDLDLEVPVVIGCPDDVPVKQE